MTEPQKPKQADSLDHELRNQTVEIANEVELYCTQCNSRRTFMKASINWHCIKCGSALTAAEVGESWRSTYRRT